MVGIWNFEIIHQKQILAGHPPSDDYLIVLIRSRNNGGQCLHDALNIHGGPRGPSDLFEIHRARAHNRLFGFLKIAGRDFNRLTLQNVFFHLD